MLSASNLYTTLFVTVMVILFVVLLPYIDRKTCKKLNVDLKNGLHGSSRENRLLRLRRFILVIIFFLYAAVNVYLVFFSRAASEDYLIHVAPLDDLISSVNIDTGILGLITDFYRRGITEGFSHIHIEKPEDIAQIYLNIMLYVPLGYLLPYTFEWFRSKKKLRPVLFCLLVSFLTENLQLIFKRGFYDIDDIISNTLGGYIGQKLYISLAYVVEHPDWRRELKTYRRWKRRARKRTLYPFAKNIGITRTTLVTSDKETVTDFYVRQLGFRPVKQILYDDNKSTDFLLQLGSIQLEIICFPEPVSISEQRLALSVSNIVRVKKRLNKSGFDTGEYFIDPYTGVRMLKIHGPDNVTISFIEE